MSTLYDYYIQDKFSDLTGPRNIAYYSPAFNRTCIEKVSEPPIIVKNDYYAGKYMMINTIIFPNSAKIEEYRGIIIILNYHTENSLASVKQAIDAKFG